MIRTLLLLCCLYFALLVLPPDGETGTSHTYITGKIEALDATTLTIKNVQYTIDPKCRFVKSVYERRAYHERPASRGDLVVGRDITVKSYGGFVREVIINDWKR